MRVRWFGMAEASAYDGRGVITVIGVGQNVVFTPALPTAVRRSLVFDVELQGVEAPATFLATFSIESPSGVPIMAQTQEGELGPPRFPDLPTAVLLEVTVTFGAREYGTYKIRAEFVTDAGAVTADQELYVRSPESAP